jgi:hypothetical protein
MKTTILIKENRTQLILEHENDHEKEVLKILEKLPNTHRTQFYNTNGGYTAGSRQYYDEDLLIVFDHVEQEIREGREGIDITDQVQEAREKQTRFVVYKSDGEGGVIGEPLADYDFRDPLAGNDE